ncbi:MAG TPA: hypothetical protein VIO64_10115 [Pseudobacteroides sp.]|uniref:hypothetical protein n=1 Tax=Pseudobacteroides sp. TaxID=1968840 RepID=UPI002F934C49
MNGTYLKYLAIFFIVLQTGIFSISSPCLGMDKLPEEPTAIVVDADTGQPVEGAVAIAIWRTGGDNCAAFEGGCEKVLKIEEVLSDKDGKIYIKNFWKWHLERSHYPSLNVYKFGYVCWDRYWIFGPQTPKRRTDFSETNKIIKIQVRPKVFSFKRHSSFVSECLRPSDYPMRNGLFFKEFSKELPYSINEN